MKKKGEVWAPCPELELLAGGSWGGLEMEGQGQVPRKEEKERSS